MIFRDKPSEEPIDIDLETEKVKDQRIINDLKVMMMQIENDIRLLENTLTALESKYGIDKSAD